MELITYMHFCVIVVEKTQCFKMLFKTEQCHVFGKVGPTFQEYAVSNKKLQNAPRGHGNATNLVENQVTEQESSSPNDEYMLFQLSHKQLHHPGEQH